ncbi:MAG: autotransporter domain-containing protein [Rhizobiaceae bacterium]|nr:autotransporter domain-containing protein [Rhizobiaceae bacterium]
MSVLSNNILTFKARYALLMAATSIVSYGIVFPVTAADVTITSGSTVGQQTISDGDTLIVESGATVNSTTPGVVDAVDGTTIGVQNNGTITSTADTAIDNTGSTLNLTNNGSISGAASGIISLNAGTFVNNADIVGTGANGVYIVGNTNQFTNTGSITGGGIFGLLGDGTLTSFTNTGLITGPQAGAAYFSIGTATNSGTISGALDGLVADTFTSLTNTGLITGTNDSGLRVNNDLGSANNTGTISGGTDGILTGGKLDSLTNTGLITGTAGSGIDTGGLFGFLNNMGTISGSLAGVDAEDLGTVVNSGLITGGDGLFSNDNLVSLTNTGTITGTGITCICTTGAGVYIANTAGTITNTGAITGDGIGIDVADLTSLFNSGSITGTNDDGVFVDGGTLGNLINTGSITGAGDGVSSRFITMLTNTGSITGGFDGVFAQTITSLTNTGSITGTGNDGIAAETLTALVNSGTISGGDDGIDVRFITGLTNNGAIIGQDEGVKSREITLLTNNGTITGGGASDESGIDTDFGTIVNNGLIQGGIGIEFDRDNSDGANLGNAKVTNNGTIKSLSGPSGVAIDFQVTGADTLTLGPNSIIVGAINWDGIGDTLNLNPNVNTFTTFSTLPATINTSSNFVKIDGNTVIQVDTSFLASVDDIINGVSGNANHVVFNQLNDDIFGDSAPTAQAYNANGNQHSTNVWNSNWLSYSQLDTTSTSSTDYTSSVGSVFGADLTSQFGTKFGAYAGLGFSQTEIGSNLPHRIGTDNYFAGLYSQFTAHDVHIDLDIQAGQMQFNSARLLANNNVASGFETASANFDGAYFAPNIRLSKEVVRDSGFSLIPSLALGYTGMYVDGYTESGSSANATIASRTIHQVQARAKLGARHDWTADNNIEYIFMPYAGLEGRLASGDIDQVTGTITGTTTTFNPGGDKSVGAVFAGINIHAELSETARFESATEAKFDSAGQLGISTSWGVKFIF